jgi:hypothetical protein
LITAEDIMVALDVLQDAAPAELTAWAWTTLEACELEKPATRHQQEPMSNGSRSGCVLHGLPFSRSMSWQGPESKSWSGVDVSSKSASASSSDNDDKAWSSSSCAGSHPVLILVNPTGAGDDD